MECVIKKLGDYNFKFSTGKIAPVTHHYKDELKILQIDTLDASNT